ncbi:hypothetical protein [Acidaminococcus sp.]|uniref:hypothetical protein n=1 Tax=Acidaminococcus sp. TaxID=1872103 RepID=UPI003D7EC341
MARFYDAEKILDINMYSVSTGEDFAEDFFEDGLAKEKYNEVLDAYRVDNVDYLVDYAKDNADPEYNLVYTVDDRANVNNDVIAKAAADLYVRNGRSAADRDQLKKEYDLTNEEVDALCKELATYEK